MPGRNYRFTLFVAALLGLGSSGTLAHDNHAGLRQEAPQIASGSLSITTEGDRRIFQSDGLPAHETGTFPNSGNPHTIRAQSYDFWVPLNPKRTGRTVTLGRHPFGIAVNGVIFDPGTAGFWNRDPNSGWRREALGERRRLGLDGNNAHVQPNGAYHYHGVPTGLLARKGQATDPVLIGYAADGFPIYGPIGYRDAGDRQSGLKKLAPSYRLKQGMRPGGPGGPHDGRWVQDYEYAAGSGDLDDCNGRVGVTAEYPNGTYYYVVTEAFPGVPRCFKGTPDESFTIIAERRRHRMGPGPRHGRRDRPHRRRDRY